MWKKPERGSASWGNPSDTVFISIEQRASRAAELAIVLAATDRMEGTALELQANTFEAKETQVPIWICPVLNENARMPPIDKIEVKGLRRHTIFRYRVQGLRVALMSVLRNQEKNNP